MSQFLPTSGNGMPGGAPERLPGRVPADLFGTRLQRFRGGLRPKLTKELGDEIVRLVREGNPLRYAAAANNVHAHTVDAWIRLGRKRATWRPVSKLWVFSQAVEKARALYQIDLVGKAQIAMAIDPKTALEILARRYPEEWGRRDTTTHVGDAESPIVHVHVGVPRGERQREAKVIEAITEEESDQDWEGRPKRE